MVDTKALKERIDESGMTIVAISSKSGMLRETLYNRLKGKSDFRLSEVMALTNILHMSKEERDKIFFAE